MPRLRIDSDLGFRGITSGWPRPWRRSRPLGPGIRDRCFATRGVEVVDGPRKLGRNAISR